MNSSTIRKIMHRKTCSAMRGCFIWHRLIRKYKLKNNIALFFPSTEHSCNYYALLYLEQLITHTNSGSAIILTVDEHVKIAAPFFSLRIAHVVKISEKDAQNLLDYYSLGPFDNRFYVVSLNKPFGRNADKLVGKNGTTVAEIISLAVFRLPKFIEEAPPVYSGSDPTLTEFLDTKEFSVYGD